MTMKNLIVRVAGGALALGLMAVAIGAAPRSADACSGPNCPQNPAQMPQNIPGPVVTAKLPDLVFQIKKASCGYYPEGGWRLLATLRVQNLGDGPAVGPFDTNVWLDNVLIPNMPKVIQGPLYGGQEFSINIPTTKGSHFLMGYADVNGDVPESNNSNNVSFTNVFCG